MSVAVTLGAPCLRCGGQIGLVYGERSCLQCGHAPPDVAVAAICQECGGEVPDGRALCDLCATALWKPRVHEKSESRPKRRFHLRRDVK